MMSAVHHVSAGTCGNIRAIIVEVSASDYFEEPDTQEAQQLFGEILATLQVSVKRAIRESLNGAF